MANVLALDQPAVFDISAKFKRFLLAFDEAADLVEWALKTETFTPVSFKTFTTHLAIVADVTALCGGLNHQHYAWVLLFLVDIA